MPGWVWIVVVLLLMAATYVVAYLLHRGKRIVGITAKQEKKERAEAKAKRERTDAETEAIAALYADKVKEWLREKKK